MIPLDWRLDPYGPGAFLMFVLSLRFVVPCDQRRPHLWRISQIERDGTRMVKMVKG